MQEHEANDPDADEATIDLDAILADFTAEEMQDLEEEGRRRQAAGAAAAEKFTRVTSCTCGRRYRALDRDPWIEATGE